MIVATEKIGRILLIRLRKLGDVVLDTPLLRELKNKFPWVEIYYLTSRMYGEVLENNSYIFRVIPFHNLNPFLLEKIRELHFDAVIDLMGNFISLCIIAASGARYRIAHTKRMKIYNVEVPYSSAPDYTVYHRLDLLRAFGMDPSQASIELDVPVDEASRDRVEEMFRASGIRSDDFVVSFQVETDGQVRSWAPRNFAKLADMLKEKLGAKVVLIQPPKGGKAIKEILAITNYRHILLPPLNLKELCAFMSLVNLHFGPDSGPRHLAISQGTPTYSLFTTANPLNWTPPDSIHGWITAGVDCQPCETRNPNKCPTGSFDCLKIPPERVFDGMSKHLNSIGLFRG